MTDTTRTQELLLLGEIKGIVQSLKEGQEAQARQMKGLDARLRAVEQKAAVTGAVSGGVMSIGLTLLAESLRAWMHRGN
ncbi:hypothetical protein ACQV5M_19020 [Leptospira sp. SA-E8]|uniref:hypothetical protein n=1 Tax=Leptospira sp. SA-E8 TaxID=3422259 RepID=UPI003EC04C12